MSNLIDYPMFNILVISVICLCLRLTVAQIDPEESLQPCGDALYYPSEVLAMIATDLKEWAND